MAQPGEESGLHTSVKWSKEPPDRTTGPPPGQAAVDIQRINFRAVGGMLWFGTGKSGGDAGRL